MKILPFLYMWNTCFMAGSHIITRNDEKPYKLSNLNARSFLKIHPREYGYISSHCWTLVPSSNICSPNHEADVESLPMTRAKKVCWISIKIGIFGRNPNPKKACIDSEPWKSWEYQQHRLVKNVNLVRTKWWN